MPRAIFPLLLLVGLLPACLFDDFERDGRTCSQRGTCPPGQRCSPDGECLAPCPQPACVGASCGCERLDLEPDNRTRVCLADGLCHVTCSENPASGCVGACDVAAGICRPSCQETGCANDAGCTNLGGTPQVSVCIGVWPDGGI